MATKTATFCDKCGKEKSSDRMLSDAPWVQVSLGGTWLDKDFCSAECAIKYLGGNTRSNIEQRVIQDAADRAMRVGDAYPCSGDPCMYCEIVGNIVNAIQFPETVDDILREVRSIESPEYATSEHAMADVPDVTPTRTFALVRDTDVSGISGTGVVAEGLQFSDGTCVMRWLTETASTAVYASIADIETIHGHDGATRIAWAIHQHDDLRERVEAMIPGSCDPKDDVWCDRCGPYRRVLDMLDSERG